MTMRRAGVVLASGVVGVASFLMVSSPAGAAGNGRTALPGSHSKAVASAPVIGTVSAATSIDFEVALRLADPGGATTWAQAVSDPGSSQYRHYLTAAQWERRFSPTPTSVSQVRAWLAGQGFTVSGVTPDRMTVSARGTAAQIESAFGTTLNNYRVRHKAVRLAATDLSIPSALAGAVEGVTGLDGTLATPDHTGAPSSSTIPFPPGFRNPQPCSASYAEKTDTTDPAFGGGYPATLPYTICGYGPTQFQSAYGLNALFAAGDTGAGVTVAIVDAYASPSLLADAQKYYELNDPSEPLASSQFSKIAPHHFNLAAECGASGWFNEQTLDVEAVHATAPGAHILYVGAKNCAGSLFDAVQKVVDKHAADIITDSWGDTGGDLLNSSSIREAFDNVLIMAAGTGIGVQFSSGDAGDNYAGLGLTTPDYPASSPWVTAVGGTALQVGAQGQRQGELGWSTSKSTLCTKALVGAVAGCTSSTVGSWQPPAPGAYLYGGGGGTSYQYSEPSYQASVVPAPLADRNQALTGESNRVEPDISMDADIQTGMVIGETQDFKGKAEYGQFKLGGTSLASPLFAGVMAVADQMAGKAIGFANPALYSVARRSATNAVFDVVPGGLQANVRVDFVDTLNARHGETRTVRTFTYEGPETYCDGTGNCGTQNVALSTAPGFDSMTGMGTPGPGLESALAGPKPTS
jgi:subtilase family serine protease